jgi:hypothetical protein
MNRLTHIIWLLLIAWILTAWTADIAAQSPTLVHLEPAEVLLPVGETTRLTIGIAGATDLFGLELYLVYDPAVIQVLDDDAGREGVQLTPGDMLDPVRGFMVINAADNEAGELAYAMTLLAPAEAVSGDGILATFDIQALSNGTSPLILSAILASADGAALPVTVEGGQVTVGDGEASETPAQTPTATAAGATAVTPVGGESPLSTAWPTATAMAPGGGIRTATPTEIPSTTNAGNGPSGSGESVVETEPTTSLQAVLPAMSQGDGSETNQPEAQDQATAIPAVESGDDQPTNQASGQATVSSTIAPDQDTAVDGESQSESNDGSLMAGGVVLVGLLLIAVVIFFGRRLLGRK